LLACWLCPEEVVLGNLGISWWRRRRRRRRRKGGK